MDKRAYIKLKTRRKEEFQFFMHDFVDECVAAGIEPKKDILPSYKWHIRALFREALLRAYRFCHKHAKFLISRKEALIIPANGGTILDIAFPYYGSYEIIPFLWDIWPPIWKRMYEAFRLLDIRTVFVTSSQVCDMINSETDIKAIFIPEGITTSHYSKGEELAARPYDIAEIGRQHPDYHKVLITLFESGKINKLLNSNINSDGTLNDKNVALTNDEFYSSLPQYKVMICFPQCDTNPHRAGKIETLTQRYWEAMLSRCILVGRAPKELINLIGYNPVIEVDWNAPAEQLTQILSDVASHQELVDRNYSSALKYASWVHRMDFIKQKLKENNYTL